MKITVKVSKDVPVRYLQAECGVRYWEDATVDGVSDEDGTLVPCREGDLWKPLIDLETGQIKNWRAGVTAEIHYKVCDAGVYRLLDEDMQEVAMVDDYVISMMSPKDGGYGDYVIMDINADGFIQKWRPSFDEFASDQ